MTDRTWRDTDRDRCAQDGSAAPVGASAVRRSAEPTLDRLLAEPIVQLLMHRDRTDETTVRRLLRQTSAAQPASRAKDDPRADDPNTIVRLLLDSDRKSQIQAGSESLRSALQPIQPGDAQRACREKAYHLQEKPMPRLSHIDPRSSALLVMDYQVDTLTRFMTAAQSADAIACVPDLIAMARDAGMMVLHVVVAFRPGHPEVSPRNPLFSALKANGMAVAGSEGAAIHPAAAAREGEPIVVKHRISPFVGTHQRRRAVDRSPRRRSGLSAGRRPRLLRRPRCGGACDAARHRHREAGGRRHYRGARRRPAWRVFMNERER
jgi:Isochorismatase family